MMWSKTHIWKWCHKSLPIFRQFGNDGYNFIKNDFTAGLMVAVLLIPQAMAYALLAGMPPIYGLYASVTPLILYALFASSRHLSVGPVAISALLIFPGVSRISQPGTEEYIQLVILLGLLVGIVQFSLGFLRLGFLVNFISHPVIAGFTSAAALIIILSQIQVILHLDLVSESTFFKDVWATVVHAGSSHLKSLFTGLSALVFILLVRRVKKSLPSGLMAIAIGILCSYYFGWENLGLEVVGSIPSGLPQFAWPMIKLEAITQLLPTVMAVTLIGIVESISIAKAIESKEKSFTVVPDKELLALGISKIGGAFFQAMPSSGSFSRSAINVNAGARSQMSSVFSALIVMVTLLFLTPLFYHLPTTILAALIIAAVFQLLDYHELSRLWQLHRPDFWMMLGTFAGTLIFGIEAGVFLGVTISILAVVYRSSKPQLVVLGNVPGTTHYRSLDRFESLNTSKDILILRFDEKLYFGNALYFKEKILRIVDDKPDVRYVIIEAGSVNNIDSTGIDILADLDRMLEERGIELHLSGVIGVVRDVLYKAGLLQDPDRHHMALHQAVKAIELSKSDEEIERKENHRAMQTNAKKK